MDPNNIPNIRIATSGDKYDFKNLWKLCFGDSDSFCNWFFEHRFLSEYSVVLENNAGIISCMQAFPYSVLIRGKEVPGAMLCGVSTHPDHRGRGYMGKIFSYEMNHLNKAGLAVAPHTPAVLPSYFSFGHFPVSDAAYVRCDSVPEVKVNKENYPVFDGKYDRLYPLYQKFSEKYSGMIKRTEKDFTRKAFDYGADGGKVLIYTVGTDIKGYAFYYITDTELLCVEAVAEDGYWEILLEGLFSVSTGLKFSAKLPPEITVSFPFTTLETITKGVMGLCNVRLLLQAMNLSVPYGFKIYDHVVEDNNGIFDFHGNHYTEEPVFEISAGHFLQIIVGYHSLQELREKIKIFDINKFKELDSLLPKMNCYIIDEY